MTTALRIEHLSKIYKNNLIALDAISLEVKKGDFFGLIGPNGAGKSTVIGITTGLVNRTSGKVYVGGYDIDSHPQEAKALVGLVPQEFNFNVFEKVIDILTSQAGYYGLKRRLSLERSEYYLKKLGLWEKRDQAARTLSGGMKRRLMIARALVHEPEILILDEPTAGVDIELRRSMWTFLEEINSKGITIILTTHYLEEAEQLCKDIAIISRGAIIENTSKKDLLSKLDVDTFVLDLANPLLQEPVFNNFEVKKIDSNSIEVKVRRNVGVSALFKCLAEQGIEVVSLRNKTNRLEELFVSLTSNEG